LTSVVSLCKGIERQRGAVPGEARGLTLKTHTQTGERSAAAATAGENTYLYHSRCSIPALALLFDDIDADVQCLAAHASSRAPLEPFALIACAYHEAFLKPRLEGCVSIPQCRATPGPPKASGKAHG